MGKKKSPGSSPKPEPEDVKSPDDATSTTTDREIKIGKSSILRTVFLRQIVRQLIERDDDIIRISGLGNAIQETSNIYNMLKDQIHLVKADTKLVSTDRSNDLPQLRIHFKKGTNFKIPDVLRPKQVRFMEKPKSGHGAIYDSASKETLNFGSVNAGSEELFVGGSAINSEFKKVLDESGYDCDKFKSFHMDLWNKAKTSPGRVVPAEPDQLKDIGLTYSSCRSIVEDATVPTACCFLSVFPKSKRPLKNEHNVAMVYVVGPKGDTKGMNRKRFLNEVRDCGKNIVVSVNQYNLRRQSNPSDDTPRIDLVRVCLVSAGVYKHKDANKKEIAKCLMEGLFLNPSAQYIHSPIFEFAYDDDAFKQAYDQMFLDKSPDFINQK